MSSRSPVAGRWSVAALVGILAVLPAACVHDVAGPDRSLWEATLTGTAAHPLVTGSAAAISRSRSTEAGIRVSGLDPGEYGWEIRAGSCAAPAALIGSQAQYPELVVDAGGEASVDGAIVSGRLESGQRYHVAVRNGTVVACGDLVEWG
jgi:hypothetical protein